MAHAAAVIVAVLLCAVNVYGFKSNAAPSFYGIYNGRFGLDGSNIAVTVQAVFNQGGVEGNVLFSQAKPGGPIQIHLNLMGLNQSSDNYRLSIREFPIRSSLCMDFPCTEENLGEVFNNLTGITARFDRPWQMFEIHDADLSLAGADSIIGRSLVIDREDGPEGAFICANIEQLGARREILRGTFDNQFIQGDVVIRYVTGRDDATVEADLYLNDDTPLSASLTLNHGSAGPGNSCENLDIVFGSSIYEESEFDCGPDKQRECPLGEISRKCGRLEFMNGRARFFCTDNQIGSTPRSYLFDDGVTSVVAAVRDENGNLLGCANLEMVAPLAGRTQFRTSTAFGDFLFWQTGPDDRTYVRAHLTGLRGDDFSLRIYELPVGMTGECSNGTALGGVYCKPGRIVVLPGTTATIGNLDTLLPLEAGQTSLRTTVSSSTLPLFGPYSILGRTLALVRDDTDEIVACNTIMRDEEYPPGELASLLGYQNFNNPPLPEVFLG